VILIRDCSKRFGEIGAVSTLSLEVKEGEIFGIVGPDGAGKSTLLRLIAGILIPDSGEITVAGRTVREHPFEIKERLAYMPQRFGLYEDLTVEENIDFYSGIYRIPPEKKKERKEWVIEMAGLQDRRHSRTGILSGGWKQRLAFGCAILHEPPIIFLDEPTAGVDPVSRRQFWDLIYELSGKGVTTFVTPHYMDEAEYCNRIGLIYRGDLIAIGSPDTLKTEFMQEEVLEVLCERPQDAMGEIEKLPGIKEVALFGKGLHVVAQDAGRAARDIRNLLGTTASVEKIAPSLEDVFVSLIESRARAEQPQQEVRK